VDHRSDDAAKTAIHVARRKNVETLCTRSFNNQKIDVNILHEDIIPKSD
jgi:hypothetical protein